MTPLSSISLFCYLWHRSFLVVRGVAATAVVSFVLMPSVLLDPSISLPQTYTTAIVEAGYSFVEKPQDDTIYVGSYDFIKSSSAEHCPYPCRCIWLQQHNGGSPLEAGKIPPHRAGHPQQLLGLLNIITTGAEPKDKVLLLLSKKKLDRMCPMGVYDSTDQCEFVCIDPTCAIPTQVAGFETTTILHKITDWAESNPEVIEAARELTNPTPCSVDSQLACTDRWDLQQAFIAAGVNVPRMYLIEPSANEIPRLNYPQILKTRVACGTVASHHMAVVSSAKELEEFRREHREDAVCAQDFIPHGGIIYKVFVIGGEVRMDIRPSLGDDAVGKSFDSQNMKGIVVQQKPSLYPSGVDINKVKDIALKVDGKLGLGLFGLDLIVGSRDQKYYVVDVNYFPTFKGVDGLPQLIRQLLLHQQQQ